MLWKAVAGIAILIILGSTLLLCRNRVPQQSWRLQPVPEDKAMEVYLGLRNQVLHVSSKQLNPSLHIGSNEPVAALMDMKLSERSVTIAAFIDGTASIYISNGGGYLGGGQSYPSIHDAGMSFVAAGKKFLPKMQMTKEFPLAQTGEIVFYVVTDSGVYTAHAPESEFRKRTHALTELYAAGQEIITQYRLNVKK